VTLWSLDLETTGLDPRQAEILSVGMVPIRRGTIRWVERWYSLARPPVIDSAATEAIRVHELLPQDLERAPEVETLIPEVEARLADSLLLVHWRSLDVAVLRRIFRRCGRRWPGPKVVDTAALLGVLDRRRRLVEPEPKPTPTQLAAARKALGLPPHEEHHALYDALATAELFLALRARLRLQRVRQLT